MPTTGIVKGIISNLVIVEADGPIAQNEICMIDLSGTELMAEVIKVQNNQAFAQFLKAPEGLKVGTGVHFTGNMLEATLGPGILSRNYDGLQNDLDRLDGVFLRKGDRNFPLDEKAEWSFNLSPVTVMKLLRGHGWER
jgi:V/A-type H+-transporting ATPase subunit A